MFSRLIKFWQRFSSDWHIYLDKKVSDQELVQSVEQASVPALTYYLMLALATAIATFGLLQDNATTIIGAMIIAPLMNPMVALSYGMITLEWKLLIRAAITLLTGIFWVITIAFFSSYAIEARVVGSQILGRIEPNLLDLGAAIASGLAAGMAYSRRSISSSLPGVAIAVALVPPLCVVGIGLELGTDIFEDLGLWFSRQGQALNLPLGAFLLFITNLTSIIFFTAVVFLVQGFGYWRRAAAGLMTIVVAMAFLSIPLNNSLQNFLLRKEVFHSLAKMAALYSDKEPWLVQADTLEIYVARQDNAVQVKLRSVAPEGAITSDAIDFTREFLTQDLGRPINLEVHLTPFQIYVSSTTKLSISTSTKSSESSK